MQSIYQSPEQNLANAIVLQAVTDYRNALKGISYSRRQPPEKVIKEVKKFFRSEWLAHWKLKKIGVDIHEWYREDEQNE